MQKKTRLIINILFLCLLVIILYSGISIAEVGGDCDACHTVYPGMMEKTYRAKPFEYVLKDTFCVNCHSNNTSDTIKMLGGNRVPVVFSNVKPVRPLAGGNFYYVAKDFGDRKGHNVNGISSMDAKFKGSPPGYVRASDISSIGYNPENPLTCAGSNGCHGNRNIEDPFEAVYGTHHAVDKPLDGSTTAKSYRFLKNTDKIKGVLGLEDRDWNQDSSSTKHNEYSPTMDFLCASCHADFHKKDMKMDKEPSPWFRHPAGIILPKRGEYANYNPDIPPPSDRDDIRIYSIDAPVGRVKVPASPGEEVRPGEDIVICLSCHVAHSSPYDSVLRWDYDNIYTGEDGKGGCLICHTGK
ncbi:MAG: cytochrome c3 family protein [Thermodesulfovibrionales bacterium]